MAQLLGVLLLSFFISGILFLPFIDFLYKIKLRRQNQQTKDPFNIRTRIFDTHHSWKVGTPFGGGILIIILTILLSLLAYFFLGVSIDWWQYFLLVFTFVSYGALGLYDDLKKLVNGKDVFFGLRLRYKFIIQWLLAFIIALVMYLQLGHSLFFFNNISPALSFMFVPFAAFVIVSFANALNITDGLDGLASGLYIIALLALLAISASKLDTFMGIFIAVLIGSVAAFLYFNIYKARLWLGDVGSLSLGALLAVIGLLTGKTAALGIIGGVFILEVGSSLVQLLAKKFLKRKVISAAPLHLYLQHRGWEEPKIVMRAWLVGFLFAIFGLFVAALH